MNRTISSLAALGFLLLGAGLISTNYASQKMSNSAAPTRSNGTAAMIAQDRTGGPLSSGTCGSCHSGGNYGTTFTIEVKDAGNNVVTSYTPNATYTIEYPVNTTSGTPGGYGM